MRARVIDAYVDRPQAISVEIARPAELLCMIHARVIEHMTAAVEDLQLNRDPHNSIRKAVALIEDGLQACLNHREGGVIADNLNGIYDWALQQVLLGQLRRDSQLIKHVRDVFCILAEAWQQIENTKSPVSSDITG